MAKLAQNSGSLSRRRLFAVGSVVSAGVLLAACTGNEKDDNSGNNQTVNNNAGDNTAPGKAITIAFSAPAADHGWIPPSRPTLRRRPTSSAR